MSAAEALRAARAAGIPARSWASMRRYSAMTTATSSAFQSVPCLVNRHGRSASRKSPRFPQYLYLYRRRCRDLYDDDPHDLLQSVQ
jgi:hypothetical protein